MCCSVHLHLLQIINHLHLGTATSNIAFAVKEFKRGQKYKSTKDGGINLPIGRVSFYEIKR